MNFCIVVLPEAVDKAVNYVSLGYKRKRQTKCLREGGTFQQRESQQRAIARYPAKDFEQVYRRYKLGGESVRVCVTSPARSSRRAMERHLPQVGVPVDLRVAGNAGRAADSADQNPPPFHPHPYIRG
jgi:hypothetical protein